MILHLTGAVVLRGTDHPEAWVADGRLALAAPAGPADLEMEGVILPGLVDVHCHVGLGERGAVFREEAEAQALADRATGVLLIRDAGVPPDTRWIDARADLPRIVRAGRHIARPRRYLPGFAEELDDVASLPGAMARNARAGDGWVKLVADWIDRSEGADSRVRPLWPADVLADGVAAAHEAGARVTAHAFSHEAIDPLLEAGIDCIEHGTGMDADQIAEAARRGIPVTPTMIQVDNFADFAAAGGRRYPRYAEQMRAMWERRDAQLRAFHEAGVQLLPGSDAGGTIPHGSLPAELARWVAGGIPAADVVALATWRARDFLGAGTLGEGEPADLVVYDNDPRDDITALARPRAVVLRGAVVG